MTFKMMKVIDMHDPRAPQNVFDVSHTLNGELWGNGNDSYYEFKVVENPTGEEEGASYVSDEEIRILADWLIKQGAEIGETVIVNHWW